jgi:hypothetical protein
MEQLDFKLLEFQLDQISWKDQKCYILNEVPSNYAFLELDEQ